MIKDLKNLSQSNLKFQEFAKKKEFEDCLIISEDFQIVKFEVGKYYAIRSNKGTKTIVKFTGLENNYNQFTYIAGDVSIGSSLIAHVYWEKTIDELFKDD